MDPRLERKRINKSEKELAKKYPIRYTKPTRCEKCLSYDEAWNVPLLPIETYMCLRCLNKLYKRTGHVRISKNALEIGYLICQECNSITKTRYKIQLMVCRKCLAKIGKRYSESKELEKETKKQKLKVEEKMKAS